MRHAYSSVEKRIHDRDCAEVSKIPDAEFEMLTEYRTDLKRCWLCGRRAIVRAGISCDDAKHMDAYMDLLRRFGAMTGELYALIIVNHAQLFDVKQDSVCIRCGEDTVDAVRRSGGAFSLSQQLRGAGKLRAALEADLSFAANRHAAARVSLPDQSDAPLFVARTRGAVQSGSAGAKAGRTSRTIPSKFPMWFGKSAGRCCTVPIRQSTMQEKLCTYCAENKVHLGVVLQRRRYQPFLPNLALPRAPLGSEAFFESSGTAEGR